MRPALFFGVAMLLFAAVAPALGAPAGAPPEPKFLKDAKADLTGTGRLNQVRFRVLGDPGVVSERFALTVDGVALKDELDENLQGFRVLDLSGAGKQKEIGVYAAGPSDDPAWAVYSFDGRAIHRLARIPGDIALTGNGTLVASIRGPGPLTWFYQQKYMLAKDHSLARVPQEFYPVMAYSDPDTHPSGTVKGSIAVLKTRGGKDVVVRPRKGTKLTVMLWDGGKWFGVVTHTGLFGWVDEKVLGENVEGLPAAD